MHEDLLGYLLGALEPDEMERVGEAIREDPALLAELDRLRAALRPLEEADDIYEPPADLLSRTWETIDREKAGRADVVPPVGAAPAAAISASRHMATVAAGRWRAIDIVATGVAALFMAGLVLPGILRGRYEARREACQSNLREVGASVMQFAIAEPDGRLPQLAVEGPQAFSGIYAVRLRDSGLMPTMLPLWCPSLDVPSQWVGRPVPTSEEVMSASPERLALLQQVAGGHYAYSLGVREKGRYVAPRFEGRTNFAILADAPLETLDAVTMAHEGRGFNLLYEDGRVRFISARTAHGLSDHPFLNRRGAVEAGVDPNDATLAPSWRPPFIDPR